jgi:hypothetical protein
MLSATCLAKKRTAVSLEEDEDSDDGQEEQFKSRMSRMIEKKKEVIARARDPGLNPDERRKACHDVALNMMGHPTFHDIDGVLAEANELPPEEAAEVRKAEMEAIAGNVRVMLCMTGGSVVTMVDCEEYLARLPDVYKREVIRSFKEHRPLDLTSLADVTIPPATVR